MSKTADLEIQYIQYILFKLKLMEKWRLFAGHGHKQSAKVRRMKDHLKICKRNVKGSSIGSESNIPLG